MTIGSILESLKTVWETWNIRGIVILSLLLQALLTLLAPLRKRSANACIIFLLWLAYVLADWAAAVAVGLISRMQKDDNSSESAYEDLTAFWAAFLLVHLGGPDTITAFALEDNALWHRHMLNLIFQVSAAIYVFYQTLPNNKLLIPTVLMLVTGVVKYGERTLALHLANLKYFKLSILQKPDSGPKDTKLVDEYHSPKEDMLPVQMKTKLENYKAEYAKLDEARAVKHGYHFFNIFKGLIVDFVFTFCERQMSREFFHKRTAEDAFKVIQVELNFIYEVLYTKVLVVHSKLGLVFRLLASGTVIVALVLFIRLEKHGFDKFDVWVTYCLLYGAIALDAIALFMLIFSDWSVALIQHSDNLNKLFGEKYVSFITRMNKPSSCQIKLKDNSEMLHTPVLSRRWSETICSYNLLSVCLEEIKLQKVKDRWGTILGKIAFPLGLPFRAILRLSSSFIKAISLILQKIFDCFSNKLDLTEVLHGLKFRAILSYVCTKHPNNINNPEGRCSMIFGKLCVFPLYILGLEISCFNCIVQALDNGFYLALTAHRCSHALALASKSVGLEEVLDSLKHVSRNPFPTKLWEFIFDELQVKSIFAEDMEMARNIYEAKGQWVLQDTEWVSDYKAIMEYVEGAEYDWSILVWHIATELCYNTDDNQNTRDIPNCDREFSKILSDYMLYLLFKQPTMMPNVTCISQIRFQDTCADAKEFFIKCKIEKEDKLLNACKRIMHVHTGAARPNRKKGDGSKSVLLSGCILAKELHKRGEEKWKIMGRVWVELLSYAASHCKAETHAHVLGNGGEFATFVWLLMAHLGIGEQFSYPRSEPGEGN